MSVPRKLHGALLAAVVTGFVGGAVRVAAAPPGADDLEAAFHKAYFAEVEQGNYAAALEGYEGVAHAPGASQELKGRAQARADSCREALRAADLFSLLPPDALAYAEVSRPGQHLARVLEKMGLVAEGSDAGGSPRGLISPRLLAGLSAVEGIAAALTDFDPRRGEPKGIVVLNSGRSDAVHGLLETVLAGAVKARQIRPGESILGHPSYETPLGWIAATRRLVVAGTSRDLVAAAVERLEKSGSEPGGPGVRWAGSAESRKDALVSILVNAPPLLARAKEQLFRGDQAADEYNRIQALTDLESVKSISLMLQTDGTGISLEAALDLEEGNHALAYHVLRSPPLSGEALRAVPAGAAAFIAFGLAERRATEVDAKESGDSAYVTGLDIGRELFANIREVALFVLASSGASGSNAAARPSQEAADAPAESEAVKSGEASEDVVKPERRARRGGGRERRAAVGPGVPDAALVLTVQDRAKSEALWKQLLSLAAAFAAPNGEGVRSESRNGTQVRVVSIPNGLTLRVAAASGKVIVATSSRALDEALGAASKDGLSGDPGLSRALARLPKESSKVAALHVGRLLALARSMGAGPHDLPPELLEAVGSSVILLSTTEEACRLRAKLSVEVPRLDATLDKLLGVTAASGREGD